MMKEHWVTQPSQIFLKLDNIFKSYNEAGRQHTVLDGITTEFFKSEFVAILGKSGSGKSTLLNLIGSVDRPDAGEIYLNGEHVTGMDDTRRTLFRREKIGFIFQSFNLIPTLTVWENIKLPLELNKKINTKWLKRAQELVELVGLGDRLQAFPDRLSGGEQQRVAIVRALVHDPLLVLADEPTGNLDEVTGRQIMTLLDQMTRQAGKNLVLVTHSREVASLADRNFILASGKLRECSKSQEC
jgi:putative ABC transport system ATP-binding protein